MTYYTSAEMREHINSFVELQKDTLEKDNLDYYIHQKHQNSESYPPINRDIYQTTSGDVSFTENPRIEW